MSYPALILGGVCLTGKSTLAARLRESALRIERFVEGDDLHPPEAIDKMRFGQALEEADRRTWRERLREEIRAGGGDGHLLLTCSALTRNFRDALRGAGEIRLVFLLLNREQVEARARKRLTETWEALHRNPGHIPHYFQPAIYPALIDGQFRDLKIPGKDEPDCLVIDLNAFPHGRHGPEVDANAVVRRITEWVA